MEVEDVPGRFSEVAEEVGSDGNSEDVTAPYVVLAGTVSDVDSGLPEMLDPETEEAAELNRSVPSADSEGIRGRM